MQGRYLASGQEGKNSDVLVWDLTTRTLVHKLSDHSHGVVSVAFSEDEVYSTKQIVFIVLRLIHHLFSSGSYLLLARPKTDICTFGIF